jgi:DNA-binding transcriptional LysR family regulator
VDHNEVRPGQQSSAQVLDSVALASDSFLKPSFTLEQIRTFLVVAGREHVTHAAKVLGLSQPAVTQQVQLLERALGITLLEKVGRNVRLTDAGVEVAGACLVVMRSVENLKGIAQSVRGLELGSLSIGATQVAANYYLPPVLTAFAAKYPSIDLDVTITDTADACEQVESGRLECALVDTPLPRNHLVHVRLARDDVILVAHPQHPLVAVERVSAKDLRGQRYLVWEPGSANETIAAQLLGPAYARLHKVQLASLEAVRQALLAGMGFAAVPRVAVAEDLRRGELARMRVTSRSRSICALRRPGAPSPAVDAFWELLCNQAP